ncbi:hypothetical protein [Paraburkholderia sp. C35]|uniref:terminase small subunit-like protein n=1 Tax=Paraburkholderia sp. C35 TaxID=2126993 RepID=UPI000D690380|nr:hypothetical protein [Paraburkholderia sp. C35]
MPVSVNGHVVVAAQAPAKIQTPVNSKTTDLFRGYPANIFERILDCIMRGETLAQACQRKGMPNEIAVRKRLNANPDMKARYDHAVEMRYERLVESTVDIAKNALQGIKTPSAADKLRHADLIIRTQFQAAEKMVPTKFGKGSTGEGGGATVVFASLQAESSAPINMSVGVAVKGGEDAS